MADVPDVDVKQQARNRSYSIRGRLSFSVGLEDINVEANVLSWICVVEIMLWNTVYRK